MSQVQDGIVTPAKTQVGALPSMIRLNTANGHGSTNTKIRRFSNVVTNQGSDITYADSAANGASFTINANGVYGISYSDGFVSADFLGVSVDSTQLTTSISVITASNRLGVCLSPAANFTGNFATTVYLAAGSVIRPHTYGTASGSQPETSQFTITRVA